MSRILIIGRDGQVGFELAQALGPLGELVSVGRDRIDLADPDAIRREVRAIRPQLIVNAAAYTAVDRAESEPELANAVNGMAPGVLAEEAKRLGAPLVHYSTDYVFDGTKGTPYSEDDATSPINVYGRSKLVGEEAIRAVDPPHLILRTSWVYGRRGRNFMLTMLRLAREGQPIRVVDDQWGAPTTSKAIASMTASVLVRLGLGLDPFTERCRAQGGVYNLTCSGQTTWFRFATRIFENALRPGIAVPECSLESPPILTPIRTEEFPVRTPRPRHTVLSGAKLRQAFGLEMPDWSAALTECMAGDSGPPALD